MESGEGDICYICLGEDGQLIRPCACRSLQCHQSCLARWQLQSAGRQEEKQCRFCKQDLPSWKTAFAELTQQPETSHVPVMSIQFNGQKYWLEVRPGAGGVEQFKEDVRKLLGLHQEQAFDITFECRVPIPLAGNFKLELQGLQAYDAAVYCASLTAAQRKHKKANGDSKRFVWSSDGITSSSNGSTGSPSSSSRNRRSKSTNTSQSNRDNPQEDELHRGFLTRHFSSRGSSLDSALEDSSSSRASSTAGSVDAAAANALTSSAGSRGGRIQSLGASFKPCLVSRIVSTLKALWHLSGDDILF